MHTTTHDPRLPVRILLALLAAMVLLLWARSAAGAPPSCAGPEPPLVTDLEVRQPPSLPEPAVRSPFRDPVFGRCVTRVTDRRHDLDPSDPSRGIKNEYARVQAWNADGTLILLRGLAATWYVYDASTLAPLSYLPEVVIDPRWDATDPHRLAFADGTALRSVDVTTHETSLVHDFAADFPGQALAMVWTRSEGSPSADGTTWGLMAQDESWRPVAFLVYDQASDRVVAIRDLRGTPGTDDIDAVTISPSGRFFVAAFPTCAEGTLGTDAAPCGMMVYDRSLANGRGLSRALGHNDLALDASGRDVAVYQDVDTDEIALIDLESGARTALVPIDFSHEPIGLHFSGRSFLRPGWAVVSTHDASTGSATWMDDQLFVLELKAGGRVVRLAHTHSLVDPDQEHDYWAEPHATANRDLTQVLFTSNWGRSGTEEVETYLVTLPAGWSGSEPPPPCSLSCSASAGTAATIGSPVSFTASATPTGCSSPVVYAWSFGDGGTAAGASTTHAYALAGTYSWTLTASSGAATCSRGGTVTVAAPSAAFAAAVAAVSHAPGAYGSLWRSDVAVVNPGSSAATATFTFVPGGGSPLVRTRSVAPGIAEWADVLVSLFGLPAGSPSFGALHVASDVPVVVSSRTFNQDEAGTYGGFLPAVTAAAALTPLRRGLLPHLRRSASVRTNVGLVNLGTAPVEVAVRLHDGSGAPLGTELLVAVPAGGLNQVVDVFGAAGAGDRGVAYARLTVRTPGGSAWAYASVIDNGTSDPTIVPVQVP